MTANANEQDQKAQRALKMALVTIAGVMRCGRCVRPSVGLGGRALRGLGCVCLKASPPRASLPA